MDELDNINFRDELDKIKVYANGALNALDDEHEGRFHEYVDALARTAELIERCADRM